jgi:hypothetical protein
MQYIGCSVMPSESVSTIRMLMPLCLGAVGSEDLGAGHLEVVALIDRPRLQTADVGPRSRLGVGDRPLSLVAEDPRQELALHLLAGFVKDGVGDGADVLADDRRIGALELGVEDELRQRERARRAAVLLRKAEAQPAALRHLVDERDPRRGVDEHAALDVRGELLRDEGAHLLPERFFLRSPVELHLRLQSNSVEGLAA